MLARQRHVVLMLDTAVSSAPATEMDSMAFWRGSVSAAEARKVEGASMHALLTPKSPHVNRQRCLFPLCIRKFDIEDCLKSVLLHHVDLLQQRIVGTIIVNIIIIIKLTFLFYLVHLGLNVLRRFGNDHDCIFFLILESNRKLQQSQC